MKNLSYRFLLTIISLSLLMLINACSNSTDVVESGTYEGTVDKVEPEKSEIYVKTDDGKRLELYFTDETQLSTNGATVPFSVLMEGQRVSVQVEKVGQRLDPIKVEILE